METSWLGILFTRNLGHEPTASREMCSPYGYGLEQNSEMIVLWDKILAWTRFGKLEVLALREKAKLKFGYFSI